MARPGRLFLVLSSRRAFEALAGPIPEAMRPLFRFEKPNHAVRIQALLPDCRLMLSKNDRRPACHRWILEARGRGIPTLLLVDGPLEWSNLYRDSKQGKKRGRTLYREVLHDAVAPIGDAQEQWIAHQNEGRRIVFMNYANRRIRTASSPGHAGPETEFDFLLTTAKTPYFGVHEKAALQTTLESCATALDRAGHRVLLRIMDSELREATQAKLPQDRTQISDIDEPFSDALTRTRCVVGTPSSVLLEAMAHDKPTGQLMFRDSPLFYQSGWLLGCNNDWAASFESMLAAEPERMDAQRQTLRENLSEEDFFSHCQQVADGKNLDVPRRVDVSDLEFENDLLRDLLGWRARLFAPFLRALYSRRISNR